MDWVLGILEAFWTTTMKMAPWLLFGFLAAGLLSLFFTPETISRHLGRKAGWRAIVLSVALGVPLPLCSCGVLPVAVGLRKGGAGKGATAAFLISTPQTGVDSFFATYSLLGWAFALTRPIVATLTGLLGGLIVDRADREPPPPAATAKSEAAPDASFAGKVWVALRYGYGTLFGNVSLALVVGLAISALIVVFVPQDLGERILGNDWLAFPVMLLIGMPMYVCSTGSIPVALSLMAKGLSPGAALVFLIVGPALNAASMATLLKLLGRRCTAIHLCVIAVGSVVAGLVINALDAAGCVPDFTAPAAHSMGGPAWFQAACAAALLALLAYHLIATPLVRKIMNTEQEVSATARRIVVKGMMCDHCRGAVKRLLAAYPGVTAVTQAAPDAFAVEGPLPDTLAKDIADLGYELVP